jgi:hypothetical protein
MLSAAVAVCLRDASNGAMTVAGTSPVNSLSTDSLAISIASFNKDSSSTIMFEKDPSANFGAVANEELSDLGRG